VCHDVSILDNVELPSDEQVVTAGREVLEATNSWKKGKTYQKKTVQAYSRPKGPGDGGSWHCRVSEHTPAEATFDEFWSKIGSNHAENEKEYVTSSWAKVAPMTSKGQVHQGREESRLGQEDFRDAGNLDDVL
jgi:hypothetical protein